VLGVDPGARSFGWAGVLRLGSKWIVQSRGSRTAKARTLESAAREQVEAWSSGGPYVAGLDVFAIEGYEYQGKRTAGEQAIVLPWVIGWLERDAAPLVGVRIVVVPRTKVLGHFRLSAREGETIPTSAIKRALAMVFGESAELLENEHERSAALVAVAGEARVR
jgi:hypothetical protein